MGYKKSDGHCVSTESSSINAPGESSSSLSSDVADDASSPSTSSSPPLEPIYGLTELLAQLPIKRGLSKFYHGRSQTFGSLASVKRLEDLAKKESSYTERMKSCKSYGRDLNQHRFGPKPTISKKSPKPSFTLPTCTHKVSAMVINCRN